MRYDVYSPAKHVRAHILLPAGKTCRTLLVDGEETAFAPVCVGGSSYLDFECTPKGCLSVEVLFG
jgi:hypothetical protein